jgi:transcriptional regulator with AAA-type ATPase domain
MTDPSPENSQSLDDFSDQLQDTVIDQARRLINQSQYTKALLSTLPIALMSTDRTGRICSVNRAAEELLAPRGKSGVSECFPKDPGLREKFDRCLNSGEKFTLDSHTLWTAAGEQNVVNVYLQPLYDDEEDLCGMLIAIEDQTYISFLQESVQRYASPLIQSPLVAESATMKRVADNITKHAEDDAAVLICGDPGTGKTYLAGKLHEAAGLGSTDPFIVVDCRTLDAENARQFLFGSSTAGDADRGEFRFRSVHNYGAIHLADRGSFVLQHVDALPPDAQEALLEYLERGPGDSLANVKVRISLTSSEDLERRAGEGNFDKRLMERIRPRTVQLPTLLKRRKDILPLARLFLEESEHGAGKRFGHEAENLLLSRRYNHNNVRELREAVDLAAQVATGEEILPRSVQKQESPVSCRIPVVVAKQSAEPLAAVHLPFPRRAELPLDDPVFQSLVIALPVVVLAELPDRPPQGSLPNQDHPIQALRFDRPHEPLRAGVQIW